ncbi:MULTISPECIES: enoyl-CoA hydratase-related protein [unclassified Sulfitobacter]|uniref:enoyl-CoA hydratase-related protein n=1 Tax=unclassified Sulfitobacter TaxID=196795 RepID=UPI00082DC5A2|nr:MULTISPECIES: enoyl-CoA hydratase-related protein [unclassified Sulfitobacter]|tara:strand:- start:252 stop:1052 length:801 start_codon:yes stop_codon:yes gene_type:complete
MTTAAMLPAVIKSETGAIATLTLRNPQRRNAMTQAMWNALTDAARELANRSDIRVVIIRGDGDVAFASGADISEFGKARRSSDQAEAYHATVQEALDAIEAIPYPVIAQIRGFCIGAGTAIALACDLRYLDASVRFGIPAAKLGIGYSPPWIDRLAQVVGHSTAAEILMSAKLFDVEKAQRCGFANEVLPVEELDSFVSERATLFAANAPLTLRAAKTCLRELSKPEHTRDWSSVVDAAQRCVDSSDYQTALKAFAEKRTPEFLGE